MMSWWYIPHPEGILHLCSESEAGISHQIKSTVTLIWEYHSEQSRHCPMLACQYGQYPAVSAVEPDMNLEMWICPTKRLPGKLNHWEVIGYQYWLFVEGTHNSICTANKLYLGYLTRIQKETVFKTTKK